MSSSLLLGAKDTREFDKTAGEMFVSSPALPVRTVLAAPKLRSYSGPTNQVAYGELALSSSLSGDGNRDQVRVVEELFADLLESS